MEKLQIVYFDLCCHSDHQMCTVCCMFITGQTECMIRPVVHVLDQRQGGRKPEEEVEQNMTA